MANGTKPTAADTKPMANDILPPHAGLTRSAGVMGLTGRQGDP